MLERLFYFRAPAITTCGKSQRSDRGRSSMASLARDCQQLEAPGASLCRVARTDSARQRSSRELVAHRSRRVPRSVLVEQCRWTRVCVPRDLFGP